MARIFISASSQEANLGVVAGYIEEIECNKIARAMGTLLEKSGHVVGYNDPGGSYRDHVLAAKAFNADIIICIHTNAASDPTASGMRAGCYDHTDPTRESTKLAKALLDALAPITPSMNDKMTTYRFYEVVKNVPPVAYIELSFHTNRADCLWIMQNTDLIGRKFAEGTSAYLKTPLWSPPPAINWEALYNQANTERDSLSRKISELTALTNSLVGKIDQAKAILA